MVKLENLEKRLGRLLRDNSDIQSSGSTKLWERTPGKPEDINKHKKWTCNEKKTLMSSDARGVLKQEE